MTAAWLLYVLFIGCLLAGAAIAVDGTMRRLGWATRWVWAAAMAGCVVLALVAPRDDVASAPAAAIATGAAPGVSAQALASEPALGALLRAARSLVATSLARGVGFIDGRTFAVARLPLVAAWAMASLVVVALLVAVNRRVNRARRGWPIEELHDTPVRVAPRVGPAVVGLSRPEIVVPRWLLGRSREEQRLVVVHEREHVAAGDPLLLTGGWLVAALLPWHPAVWWMLARLRLAIELDCDARVLRGGVQPQPYGTLLIDIAGQHAGVRLGALALADRTTHLERRLLAMKPLRSRFTRLGALALAAVAALFVVAACESRMPTQADVASMDAASAEQGAARAKLVAENGAAPVFTVDGVTMPAAQAKAIPAERIATIDVIKGQGSDASVIAITTRIAAEGVPQPQSTGETLPRVKVTGELPLVAKLVAEREAWKPLPSKEPFHGLVLIDGVKSTMAQMSALSPSDIEMVNIVKGVAAKTESTDPAAEFGIIKVTTKKHATP